MATSPSPARSDAFASLPSDSDSASDIDSSISDRSDNEADSLADAEREWRESLQQIELVLTMVLIPYVGKYFGRKAAYWGWAKYMEWKFPVDVVITNPRTFKAAGILEAASPL